jgi:hypothetical protein
VAAASWPKAIGAFISVNAAIAMSAFVRIRMVGNPEDPLLHHRWGQVRANNFRSLSGHSWRQRIAGGFRIVAETQNHRRDAGAANYAQTV